MAEAEAPELQQVLESHFKWRPELRATKKPKDVLKNATEKLEIDPLNKVGYLTLLAYIRTLPDTVEYKQAEEYLSRAEQACQQIESQGSRGSSYLSCRFVVESDALCIQKERKTINADAVGARFAQLQARWHQMDDESKAGVFGAKGLSLLRSGPTRYQDAAEAYAKANHLTEWNKLIYVFGEAYVLARIRRSRDLLTPADETEMKLWRRACELCKAGVSREFDRAHFWAVCAEAMLNNQILDFCFSLVEAAWKEMRRMPKQDLVPRYRGLLKSDKCCKILCKKYGQIEDAKSIGRVKQLKEEIFLCFYSVKDIIPKSSVIFHFAKERFAAKKNLECRELLEQAQKVDKRPGNVFIDCMLIFLKRITKRELGQFYGVEDCLAEYDDLIKLYFKCGADVATIKLMKAEYLARCGRTSLAFETLVDAHEQDPCCWNRVATGQLKFIFCHFRDSIDGKDEWFAWILQYGVQRIAISVPDVTQYDAADIYEEILLRKPDNQFALEHLGKLYFSQENFSKAESCFQSLLAASRTSKNRKLLAATILKENSKANMLMCCKLGCKDACEKLLQLLLKEKHEARKHDGTTWLRDKTACYTPELHHMPHCTREAYELCAIAYNLMRDDSAFYVEQPLMSPKKPLEIITEMIYELLELGSSEDGGSDRVNSLRKARFQAALILKSRATRNFNDELAKILKEAKESLDRAIGLLPSGTYPNYYVHGFNGLKKELEKDPELNKILRQKGSHKSKQVIRDQIIAIILGKSHLPTTSEPFAPESIKRYLKSAFRETGHLPFASNPRTKQIFDFLVSRESAILTHEGPWLVHWIYGTNREKHLELQNFNELNDQLEAHGKGPRSAYEMAHRAAEFAEETRLAMSCWKSAEHRASSADVENDESEEGAEVDVDEDEDEAEQDLDKDEEAGLPGLFNDNCQLD